MSDQRERIPRTPGPLDGGWRYMLRAERLRADLTQIELASRARISPETIRKYEAGMRMPGRTGLILLLDAMKVPPSRSGAVLAAAGYAPHAGSAGISGAGGTFNLDEARRSIETTPWPRLILDERLALCGANSAARHLLSLKTWHPDVPRTHRNLYSLLADPAVAERVVNLDACLTAAAGAVKAALERVMSAEDATAFADDVLADCATGDPSSAIRLMRAWEAAKPARTTYRAGFEILWRSAGGSPVRLLAASSPTDGSSGYVYVDLHPADSASHAGLERLLGGASAHSEQQRLIQ